MKRIFILAIANINNIRNNLFRYAMNTYKAFTLDIRGHRESSDTLVDETVSEWMRLQGIAVIDTLKVAANEEILVILVTYPSVFALTENDAFVLTEDDESTLVGQ